MPYSGSGLSRRLNYLAATCRKSADLKDPRKSPAKELPQKTGIGQDTCKKIDPDKEKLVGVRGLTMRLPPHVCRAASPRSEEPCFGSKSRPASKYEKAATPFGEGADFFVFGFGRGERI